MGDRGNIVVREKGSSDIYFYTHWNGYKLPFVVQEALKRGQDRWDDPPYLARIIFCELVKGYEMETTGFGISCYECDNEHPHFIINMTDQKVERDGECWTFNEYISLNVSKLKSME